MAAKKKTQKRKRYYPSGRVHHLVSNVMAPDGKTLILTREKIVAALTKHRAYSSYGFILHDKDVYNGAEAEDNKIKRAEAYIDRYQVAAEAAGLAEDASTDTGYIHSPELAAQVQAEIDMRIPVQEVGQLKRPHWHIVLVFNGPRKVDEVARWFGLPPYMDELKSRRHAADDAYTYLVHGHDTEKYQYPPSDVVASFDYAKDLDDRLAKEAAHEKYHVDMDEINDIVKAVAEDGVTLGQASDMLSSPVFLRNKPLFERARQMYINNYAPMPVVRQVFYVEAVSRDENGKIIGKGGAGKSLATKALAKHFAAEYGADTTKRYDKLREDYIYDAGDAKIAMQGYDGQPVLVLNDVTAVELLNAFNGRKGVKELLDPFPTKQEVNKKFGSTICIAKYIIINGIQPFDEFIHGIAGSFRDKNGNEHIAETSTIDQFFRRFWMDIQLIDDDRMRILINKGIFEDTDELRQFIELASVRVNWRKIHQQLNGGALATVEGRVLTPVMDQLREYNAAHDEANKVSDPDAIPDEFDAYGPIGDAYDSDFPAPSTGARRARAETEGQISLWD